MIYITNTLTKPMYPNLVKGNKLVIGDNYNVDHINNLKDYRVCVNNAALIQTFEDRFGVEMKSKVVDRVSLVPGDVVLVINPSEKIEKLKYDEILPEHITFRLEEVIVEK